MARSPTGFQRGANLTCKSAAIRNAMKSIRQEHMLHGIADLPDNIVGVPHDICHVCYTRLAKSDLGQFQEFGIDIDRDDMARDLGELKRKPAIATAKIGDARPVSHRQWPVQRRDLAITPPTIRDPAFPFLQKTPAWSCLPHVARLFYVPRRMIEAAKFMPYPAMAEGSWKTRNFSLTDHLSDFIDKEVTSPPECPRGRPRGAKAL